MPNCPAAWACARPWPGCKAMPRGSIISGPADLRRGHAAKVNDITAAQAMPIEPGATYVFDLGYYDYAWWAKLDARAAAASSPASSRTRRSRVIEERRSPPAAPILSDRIGFLPARQARSRRNPFQKPVREIRVKIETGKVLRIFSNDLDAPAAGDRRSLQAPLGDRAVLPLGQADAEDHPLPRPLRERHPHPDRRRPDRLPAAAAGPGRAAASQARSPSPASSAPTSCIAERSTTSSAPSPHPPRPAPSTNPMRLNVNRTGVPPPAMTGWGAYPGHTRSKTRRSLGRAVRRLAMRGVADALERREIKFGKRLAQPVGPLDKHGIAGPPAHAGRNRDRRQRRRLAAHHGEPRRVGADVPVEAALQIARAA